MAPCDTCGAMLEVGQQQLTHVCSGAPRYACLHCDHEAPTVNPVIVHVLAEHGICKWVCTSSVASAPCPTTDKEWLCVVSKHVFVLYQYAASRGVFKCEVESGEAGVPKCLLVPTTSDPPWGPSTLTCLWSSLLSLPPLFSGFRCVSVPSRDPEDRRHGRWTCLRVLPVRLPVWVLPRAALPPRPPPRPRREGRRDSSQHAPVRSFKLTHALPPCPVTPAHERAPFKETRWLPLLIPAAWCVGVCVPRACWLCPRYYRAVPAVFENPQLVPAEDTGADASSFLDRDTPPDLSNPAHFVSSIWQCR